MEPDPNSPKEITLSLLQTALKFYQRYTPPVGTYTTSEFVQDMRASVAAMKTAIRRVEAWED